MTIHSAPIYRKPSIDSFRHIFHLDQYTFALCLKIFYHVLHKLWFYSEHLIQLAIALLYLHFLHLNSQLVIIVNLSDKGGKLDQG